MSHSEKPFTCTSEGCNMSFVNEDHLTVHKKRHDMMLNLGTNSKTNVFIADQTPTPTRFIRNCEEVGLFEDLQNENPFEETFRRAVESGKSAVLTAPKVDNDDSLHTPNIFPPITPECSTSIAPPITPRIHVSKIKDPTELCLIPTPTVPVTKESSTENKVKKVKESEKVVVDTIFDEASMVEETCETSVDNSNKAKTETVPIDAAEMQLVLKTQDGKVLRFIAAPVLEVQENSVKTEIKESTKTKVIVNKNSNNSSKLKAVQDQKLNAAKIKLKQQLTKNGVVIENKPVKNENENKPIERVKEKRNSNSEYSKKQQILERNRASSMRARAKRKAWIEQLQDSLNYANETNANLQAQVKSLHNQVAKLKTLLLAHKDCPVTKAMEGGNGVVVGSKILTIKPDEVKPIPVVSGVVRPVKRPSTEKLIAPKKKPLILSCVKNPIILPKSNSANTITLHGVDAIKTIPTISIVSPLVTQASTTKQILSFVHSDVRKVSLVQDNIERDPLELNVDTKNNVT